MAEEAFLVQVPVPSMGATAVEIVIRAIRIGNNDVVRKGQIIAELESDKSVFEFDAPCEGIVRSICVREGEIRSPGDTFAVVETRDMAVAYLRAGASGRVVAPVRFNSPEDHEGIGRRLRAAYRRRSANTITTPLAFHFAGEINKTAVRVTPDIRFEQNGCFGFETSADADGFHAMQTRFSTESLSESACIRFSFSVRLLQDNYRVRVVFGGGRTTSCTNLRLQGVTFVAHNVCTNPDEMIEREFTIHIRNPALPPLPPLAPGGSHVVLSSWEQTSGRVISYWDEKLTFDVSGACPQISAIAIVRDLDATTLFVAGDSTAAPHTVPPIVGWGQLLPMFFGPGVSVANYASKGQTIKSFLTDLRLAKIISLVRPGDRVLIQFGHGDQKLYRAHTFSHADSTFMTYLKVYIDEVRLVGGCPILVTPPERFRLDCDGKIVRSLDRYPEAMRRVGASENVAVLELNHSSVRLFESMGSSGYATALAYSDRDHTHLSAYGAFEIARCIVARLREADLGLRPFLLPGFGGFDPSSPDSPHCRDIPQW